MSYLWTPIEEFDAEGDTPRMTDDDFTGQVCGMERLARWMPRIMAVLVLLLIVAQLGHYLGWWSR